MATTAKTKAMATASSKSSTASMTNPNGFSPELWGPSLWFAIHLAAATYPVAPTSKDRENFAMFFKSLQYVLPCMGCRKGYQTIITTDPTRLTPRVFANRQSLFKWTVQVHDRVNAKLGKKVYKNDWMDWYKQYDKFRS